MTKGLKWVLDSLELWLQVVMSCPMLVLRIELSSSLFFLKIGFHVAQADMKLLCGWR